MTIFPSGFRPMKGEPIDFRPGQKHSLDRVDFSRSMLYSVKMDGVRVLTQQVHNPAYSAHLLEFPNKFLQEELRKAPPGIEGELMVRDQFGRWLPCSKVSGFCSSHTKEFDFQLFLFDIWCFPSATYEQRYHTLISNIDEWRTKCPRLSVIPQVQVSSGDEVSRLECESLIAGFEGGILRAARSAYKYGRSTFTEHGLLKLKRYIDEEGTIVGFEELYTNNNEPTNSPLGLTKRGTSLRGLSPAGTLGAVIVRNPKYSKEFRVGGGFTLAERDEIWNNQARYLGAQITYKFQEYGTMDVPRQPVFKGFRPKYI
jgi:ATP-dependent DNA ligase